MSLGTTYSVEHYAAIAREVGLRKLSQARQDGAPPTYTAGVESTAQEIAEAILAARSGSLWRSLFKKFVH